MIPETLIEMEAELRKASASQEYAAVERRALALGDAARRIIAGLPAGDPAIAEIAGHVVDVLEWSRRLTLVGRTRAADELRTLALLRSYAPKRAPRRPRLHVRA